VNNQTKNFIALVKSQVGTGALILHISPLVYYIKSFARRVRALIPLEMSCGKSPFRLGSLDSRSEAPKQKHIRILLFRKGYKWRLLSRRYLNRILFASGCGKVIKHFCSISSLLL